MLYLYIGILVVAVLSGWFMLYKVPTIKSLEKQSNQTKKVSIIIPARNEEKNLPHLLTSIQKQSVQPFEVLVVDDYSEDNTASVAEGYGAQVIQFSKEELGWVGKSAGCYAGAKAAKGDWLLFLDADIFLPEIDSLDRVFQTFDQQKGEGILSIQPYHIIQKPYENLSAVFNILVLAGMNRFSMLQHKIEPGGAFGPSLLVEKAEYFEMGGHESVQDSIMENIALGKLFIDQERLVNLFGGKGALHFRMYPEGMASLIQGWSKSFASGSAFTHPLVLTATIFWVAGAFVSAFGFLFALFSGDPLFQTGGMMSYLLYTIQFYRMTREAGNFKWYAAAGYPFLFIGFVGIFIYSVITTHLVGSVSWKGRNMKV